MTVQESEFFGERNDFGFYKLIFIFPSDEGREIAAKDTISLSVHGVFSFKT